MGPDDKSLNSSAGDRRPSLGHAIKTWRVSVYLFACCLFIYLTNGDFPNNPDSLPNAYLSLSILREGDLTFTPEEIPELFEWELVEGDEDVRIPIEAMDDSLRSMIASGNLRATDAGYFALPVGDGRYVNTFGPGAGVASVPFFAVGQWLGIDYSDQPGWVWRVSKVAAATFTAGSVAFVYLTLARMTSQWPAILLALAYGLGTPAWSSSSQSLWQHAPTDFFLTLGIWLFLWPSASRASSLGSGLALSASVCCRPTIALVVIWLTVSRLLFERNRFIAFMLGAAPLAVALAFYNHTFLGSVFKFGQSTYAGKTIEATGREGSWSNPLLEGLWAHLTCPSRGLVEFCPFLIPAFAGILVVWLRPHYTSLRPLTLGLASLFVVQAKFFDWWGGFSYGPRHLVDAMPILILFLVPALGFLVRPLVAVPFGLALAWSIFVQGVGVTVYDVISWNGRPGLTRQITPDRLEYTTDLAKYLEWVESSVAPVTVERLTIDDPRFRQRLWSWSDQQIAYYLTHAGMSRWQRRKDYERNSRSRAERLAEAHMLIGHCYSVREEWEKVDEHDKLATGLVTFSEILLRRVFGRYPTLSRVQFEDELLLNRRAIVDEAKTRLWQNAYACWRLAFMLPDSDLALTLVAPMTLNAPVLSLLDAREVYALCPILQFAPAVSRRNAERQVHTTSLHLEQIRRSWLTFLEEGSDRAVKGQSSEGLVQNPWPSILKTIFFSVEGRTKLAADALAMDKTVRPSNPWRLALEYLINPNSFDVPRLSLPEDQQIRNIYEGAKTRRPNANERAWWLDP